MLRLLDLARAHRLLCLGAHCDDIEIGAGATIMSLIEANPRLEVLWVVFGGRDPVRVEEARRAAGLFLAGAAESEVIIHGFRDAFLPFHGEAVKDAFEALKQGFAPDLILTHHGGDFHQDHRLISQLTWNTWRDHAILEYEICKYDGDLGRPNVFVPLLESRCQRKIAQLMDAYPSQARRTWFTADVFWSLLRLRGVECNAPSHYAEAFFARKVLA